MRALGPLLVILLAGGAAWADHLADRSDNVGACAGFLGKNAEDHLLGNMPSYISVAQDPYFKEQWPLQFDFSLTYAFHLSHWGDLVDFLFTPVQGVPGVGALKESLTPKELHVDYDGLYDFYFLGGTAGRYSAPVVSRQQNPGMSLWYGPGAESATVPESSGGLRFDYFNFGYYHESDGQDIDNAADYAAKGTYARDYMSHGWDYVGAAARFRQCVTVPAGRQFVWSLYPRVRLFTGTQGFTGAPEEEDLVLAAGDPTARQPRIRDYDGLRFMVMLESPLLAPGGARTWLLPYAALSAELRHSLFYANYLRPDSWSVRLTATVDVGDIPFYLYYFDGYGPYIAEYEHRDQQLGFGLRLW